jgi:hypothetical protein
MNPEAQSSPVEPPAPPRWLRPAWLLGGLLAGLVVMSWLGRQATATDYHPGFTRFFPAISPEAGYYPTVDEMAAIVRQRTRPDQILVIVGGNSVLQGVSQPADRMWTKVLQDQLGSRYVVLNFALRGSMPMDGGEIVADALRDEFPRQIYIANDKPLAVVDTLGSEAYRPIFWQAYFAGRLAPHPAREQEVRRRLWDPLHREKSPEIVGEAVLDRVLRFRDYWNRVAFTRLNTIASIYAPAPPALFSPRSRQRDEEMDGGSVPVATRYRPEGVARELEIIRAGTAGAYRAQPDGGWAVDAAWRDQVRGTLEQALPSPLRSRTLMLVGRDSPFYRDRLSAAERARDEQAIRDTVELYRSVGYQSIDYGADFTVQDYYDRSHLTASGGQKLATAVAAEVRRLAAQRGYLP